MSKITGQTHSGHFTIGNRQILGTLKEAGEKTSLYLHDPEFFTVSRNRDTYIHGKLHNLIKVSLLDCLCPGTGSLGMKGDRVRTANVFPHYIVSGDIHIAPYDKVITQVDFHITDAETLFYDFDAFGEVIHGERFIEAIANANADDVPDRPQIKTGPYPNIFYFTGIYEIANFDTVLGKFTARHSPSYNFPGPQGFNFKNTIVTALDFPEAVDIHTALERLIHVVRYMGILIGRAQNVTGITLSIPEAGQEYPHRLEVDWSMLTRLEYADEKRSPHPMDVLIDPIKAKADFATVTSAYLERTESWQMPRARYYRNFEDRRHYSPERLVAAANMFDILPDTVFGRPPDLDVATLAAQQTARDAFRTLPDSADRDSILSLLGRLGKWTLKKKIASRVATFAYRMNPYLPELAMVTERAVNARNFFVHGGKPDFDYEKHSRTLQFFVDALEYTFAASDLADAGWKVDVTSGYHPFGSFTRGYMEDLALLKSALSEAKANDP